MNPFPTQFHRQPNTKEFELSTPSVLRTDKTLNVKNFHIVTENETTINHGQKIRVRLITQPESATVNVLLSDFIVGITDVGVSRTVVLPKPSLAGFGKIYVIKDASGSATTTTIAITSAGSEIIDGDSSSGITSNYGVKRLYTDGANWFTY